MFALRVFINSKYIVGTQTRESKVVSSVPPAIAMAKGGQNPPPAMISGINPPTVVMVVELIWRPQLLTVETMVSISPSLALGISSSSAKITMAALMASPIKPSKPMMTGNPKG